MDINPESTAAGLLVPVKHVKGDTWRADTLHYGLQNMVIIWKPSNKK